MKYQRLRNEMVTKQIIARGITVFEEHQILWNELAFPVVRLTLEHYFKDLKAGHFPVHVEDIHQHPARRG